MLLQRLIDPSLQMRMAARSAATRLAFLPGAETFMREAASSPTAEVRVWGLTHLGNLQDPPQELIIEHFKDPSPSAREGYLPFAALSTLP